MLSIKQSCNKTNPSPPPPALLPFKGKPISCKVNTILITEKGKKPKERTKEERKKERRRRKTGGNARPGSLQDLHGRNTAVLILSSLIHGNNLTLLLEKKEESPLLHYRRAKVVELELESTSRTGLESAS